MIDDTYTVSAAVGLWRSQTIHIFRLLNVPVEVVTVDQEVDLMKG